MVVSARSSLLPLVLVALSACGQPAVRTATALSASASSIVEGATLTLSVTLTPATAPGNVTFLDGAAELGSATLADGSASLDTTALSPGSHGLSAVYAGASGFAGSTSGTVTVVVTPAPVATTVALTATATSIQEGASVRLTATIAPSSATGTVTFLDGDAALGMVAVVSGVASLSTSDLAAGEHALTADYSGSSAFLGSTSATVTVTVTPGQPPASTSTTLTTSTAEGFIGNAVTLAAALTPAGAVGTVTFLDDDVLVGSAPVFAGTAYLLTFDLQPGDHSITALYSGAAGFAGSVSDAVAITILEWIIPAIASSVTLETSATSIASGDTVSLTASVGPTGATGTVTFVQDATVLGVAPVSSGNASLSTSLLPVGAHTVAATYSGSDRYGASTSPAVVITVAPPQVLTPTTTTLTPSATSVVTGATLDLVATVSPGTATGLVTFFDGITPLGTATLTAGSATLGVTGLEEGAHDLTATYGGDATYDASTSSAVTVTAHPPDAGGWSASPGACGHGTAAFVLSSGSL
ncbi:MAG TPA: Ig-like domain-containing protein, partial [Acidimicrobiales bacterium]|nr:Ig-like domain-containing protein [Acidimicrobiales bacterium]